MEPTELRLSSDKQTLIVVWPEREARLRAETLRVNSPSAEVKGHFGVGGKVPVGKEAVRIVGVEPVGNYAVRLTFDDGHRTGIYTWEYLAGLAS